MKRYIREVLIPEYARNFNKTLSAEDIKFYGKDAYFGDTHPAISVISTQCFY